MNDTPLRCGVGVYISHSDREAVEELADERGLRISDVLREAVSHYLDTHDAHPRAGAVG